MRQNLRFLLAYDSSRWLIKLPRKRYLTTEMTKNEFLSKNGCFSYLFSKIQFSRILFKLSRQIVNEKKTQILAHFIVSIFRGYMRIITVVRIYGSMQILDPKAWLLNSMCSKFRTITILNILTIYFGIVRIRIYIQHEYLSIYFYSYRVYNFRFRSGAAPLCIRY